MIDRDAPKSKYSSVEIPHISQIIPQKGLDRVQKQNVVLAIALVILLNTVLYFGCNLRNWAQLVTVQAFILEIFGVFILAIPDIPRLKKPATPPKLREGWGRLTEKGQLTYQNPGFEEIVELIDKNTDRVYNPDDLEKLTIQNIPDYGSQDILSSNDTTSSARYQLTETEYLRQWISEERERKYRIPGLILIGSGFMFQLGMYIILNWIATVPSS
jgi:hypothetical protein